MSKIECMLCGEQVHSIAKHIEDKHSDECTILDYEAKFPEAPLESQALIDRRKSRAAQNAASQSEEGKSVTSANTVKAEEFVVAKAAMDELFGMKGNPEALNRRGQSIQISVYTPPTYLQSYVPEKDADYVMSPSLLKTVLIGLETRVNVYLHGHMGSGKSTMFEVVCAYTNRPMIRIQHTRDTEQSHIVGQWLVKNGATVFELGPLAYAMKHGLVYLADEYDFAMPAVLAIYQPVLEGKPLIIKEADAENRIIHPHPNFRIVATGNTNGSGDETGLYQGTVVQNAANYERFGIVEKVNYMSPDAEIKIIAAKTGADVNSAKSLVRFGTLIRESYGRQEMSLPISPRSLINAANLGVRFGDFKRGLELAFINRLDSTSAQTAMEIMGRIYTS